MQFLKPDFASVKSYLEGLKKVCPLSESENKVQVHVCWALCCLPASVDHISWSIFTFCSNWVSRVDRVLAQASLRPKNQTFNLIKPCSLMYWKQGKVHSRGTDPGLSQQAEDCHYRMTLSGQEWSWREVPTKQCSDRLRRKPHTGLQNS